MSDYSITITGLEELIKRLDAAGDSKTLQGSLESIGQELVTKNLMKYPPIPAGSAYKRTNKLRGSWSSVADNGTLTVGSDSGSVPYNRLVMDRDEQTSFHARHGWKTVQGILQLRLEWIKKQIIKDIQKALGG